jgi:hypothetical protein
MPTRLSKQKLEEAESINSLAARIAAQTTGQEPSTPQPPPLREKNAAAVALGRLGASKGGKARAENLSASQRKRIATNAAKMRWAKRGFVQISESSPKSSSEVG